MVSNYFLGMDNIPQNNGYRKKTPQEVAKIAITKTDQEMNTKRFNRNSRLADIGAIGMIMGNALLNNGAAATTLLTITDFLPFIGVFAIDRLIKNKNEKYKKFCQENPTSTTLGAIGVGFGAQMLTRGFFEKNGRDYRTYNAIANFYNKISNFIKGNPVSKKISEVYNTHFPEGGKNFFRSVGNKISNVKDFLRENTFARGFLKYAPLVLFIGNIIKTESFRMKRQDKAQEYYQKLSIMNEMGQL